jgi:methylamine dehydrogenase accessory protein MauD
VNGPWLVSYVVLWAVVLFQGVVIFVVLRQLGMMYLGTAQGVARDGIAPGQRAPDFTATGIAGDHVSLAGFRGMPLLMVFGSATCAPCRGLIPDLNAFALEKREELRALFLCRGGVDEARRFADELQVQVPVAVHPDEALAEEYKTRVTPFGFIIDADGVVLAKGLTNNRSHLDMLLEMAEKEQVKSAKSGRNGSRDAAVARDKQAS